MLIGRKIYNQGPNDLNKKCFYVGANYNSKPAILKKAGQLILLCKVDLKTRVLHYVDNLNVNFCFEAKILKVWLKIRSQFGRHKEGEPPVSTRLGCAVF